jgi:hypothetical protein
VKGPLAKHQDQESFPQPDQGENYHEFGAAPQPLFSRIGSICSHSSDITPGMKKILPRQPASLFGRWLRAWNALSQEFDLAIVVGFVFGDMKPFGVVVSREVAVRNQRR